MSAAFWEKLKFFTPSFKAAALVLTLDAADLLRLEAAEGPVVKNRFPLGIVPGATTRVRFEGERLAGTELWTSFPAQIQRAEETDASSKSVSFDLALAADQPVGVGALQLFGSGGVTDFQMLAVDPLPALVCAGANASMPSAQTLSPPVAVDGAAREVSSQFFRFNAERGQRVAVEVLAARLGSAMDPVLRILDANGRELAHCEDAPALGPDTRIDFIAPRKADYFIELRDTRYQGGANFFYRLRVGGPMISALAFQAQNIPKRVEENDAAVEPLFEREPNDFPSQATHVSIPSSLAGHFSKPRDRDFFEFTAGKNQRLIISGKTRSLGSPCDLFFQVLNQADALVAEANVAGADEGALTNTFAEAGVYRLQVEELNRQGESNLFYRIDIATHTPGFALAAEANTFHAAPDGTFELKITATRRDYDGPITLALSHAAMFTLTNSVIPAKTNSVQLKAAIAVDWSGPRLIHFHALGHAETNGVIMEARASTRAALKKTFPGLLHPPAELDGFLSLSVIASGNKKD